MLNTIGDVGFVVSAAMFILFGFLFLTSVRWWTDALGRAIAAVLVPIILVMALASVVLMGIPLPGLQWWRAFLYGTLGTALTVSNGMFIWAQFFAPRIRRKRTTPPVDWSESINTTEEVRS
ncbi:MAG: hypothetical protein ABW022_22060 [Actinoplanes sp.]